MLLAMSIWEGWFIYSQYLLIVLPGTAKHVTPEQEMHHVKIYTIFPCDTF